MAQIQFLPEACLVATSVNPAGVKPLGSEKIVDTGIHLARERDFPGIDRLLACLLPPKRKITASRLQRRDSPKL